MEPRRPERPLSVSPLTILFGLTLAVYGYTRWRWVAHLRGPATGFAGPSRPRPRRHGTAEPASRWVVAHRSQRPTSGVPGNVRPHPWLHRWCTGRCRTSRRWARLRDAAFLLGVTAGVPAWVTFTSGRLRGAVLALGSIALGAIAERDRPHHRAPAGGVRGRHPRQASGALIDVRMPR